MITGSAMGAGSHHQPGRCEAQFPNANCQNLGPGNPYTDNGYRRHRVSYRQSNGDWKQRLERTHTGFCQPTSWAMGRCAIGTGRCAIATRPFRAMDNSYAYDNDWNNSWDNRGWDTRSYAQRNGFRLHARHLVKGEDGRRQICQ